MYEVGEDAGLLFIAMRFVEGTDLRELIAGGPSLALERAARIIAQVGGALDAAHGAGLVHRDVKPANVLIAESSEGDHAYLTDFGLTKHITGEAGLTKTGMMVGTFDYMAPSHAYHVTTLAERGSNALSPHLHRTRNASGRLAP